MPLIQKLVPGDIEIMSRVVFGEARNQGFSGMIAVANIIINRLKREPGRFPGSIYGICTQRFAFSCLLESDPQAAKVRAVNEQDPAYVECMYAVLSVLLGKVPDNTSGADHYARYDCHPSWVKSMSKVAVVGEHVFYKENRV
jgi:N-acetylmuramoyl-L-alanine amidase